MDARSVFAFDTVAPAPVTIHRRDYRPPSFAIPTVALTFEIGTDGVTVTSQLDFARNPAGPGGDLRLDGRKLDLVRAQLDGQDLPAARIAGDSEGLTLLGTPDSGTLTLVGRFDPAANTELEGLYQSNDMLCTQCEAEGFRKITWFPDRPDVMSRYRVTIRADKAAYPVLLSNGNLIASRDLEGGRHEAVWEDPFPKPCYLFALVAGRLDKRTDQFVTASGRRVLLEIYARGGDVEKCGHAMESLKKAMRWDEEVFGLEYDLDRYMIVAVGDFNMGAMENKGLNVFNTKYILASEETATDNDFQAVEAVVAHEYFHNWTGNRVTCRDWFQLSLKEGLTVFRDQQFSMDMGSASVKRIVDVRALRGGQFPEDAGPMAHPVRPESYMAIDNFYTATVYNKGAEVVRMYQTLLGRDGFRKGMDLYFARHDGQAVTCDDFRAAMADANGVDLTQFGLWYSQAGTPVLTVVEAWDAARGVYGLTFTQSCPPTPGQSDKAPMHVPVRLALLGPDGAPIALTPDGAIEMLVEMRAASHSLSFADLPARPVPSLLRGFSAPVQVEMERSDDDRAFLFAHDSDPFARWEAGQELMTRMILQLVADQRAGHGLRFPENLLPAFETTLARRSEDPAFVALALTLPVEGVVGERMAIIAVDELHAARQFLRAELGRRLHDTWQRVLTDCLIDGPYRPVEPDIGKRGLAGLALAYLLAAGSGDAPVHARAMVESARNMTEVLAGLSTIIDSDLPDREILLDRFAEKWADDPLVLDKWFGLQAFGHHAGVLARVKQLAEHRLFEPRNPNKIYALYGAFAANQAKFHAADGSGYAFLGDKIRSLDPVNGKVAARLAGRLIRWKRFDETRQAHMKRELEAILALPGLSRDTMEVVSKGLA